MIEIGPETNLDGVMKAAGEDFLSQLHHFECVSILKL